jgi:hypothetical protein
MTPTHDVLVSAPHAAITDGMHMQMCLVWAAIHTQHSSQNITARITAAAAPHHPTAHLLAPCWAIHPIQVYLIGQALADLDTAAQTSLHALQQQLQPILPHPTVRLLMPRCALLCHSFRRCTSLGRHLQN